jgi:hypothetical protein
VDNGTDKFADTENQNCVLGSMKRSNAVEGFSVRRGPSHPQHLSHSRSLTFHNMHFYKIIRVIYKNHIIYIQNSLEVFALLGSLLLST